jgi:8-oxo-dGTP diphosphatase
MRRSTAAGEVRPDNVLTGADHRSGCGVIDWSTWKPTMRATLIFVVRGREVLLIHKKRGLGAGKINGPGGRIEDGESPADAAVRELHEELGILAHDPELRGELHFDFVDGLRLHCLVFLARQFSGEPTETDEAVPLWTRFEDIPFERMWADDRHWLPGVLDGGKFRGWFEFDGERMLSCDVRFAEAPRVSSQGFCAAGKPDGPPWQ